MCLHYAARNVLYCGWKKGTAIAYCCSSAIPDRVTDRMYHRFHSMSKEDDTDGDAVETNKYVSYVWLSIISMSAWIDAGMHHIFH